MSDDDGTLFDRAVADANDYSEELGESGHVAIMSFEGSIGLHEVIAEGAAVQNQARTAALIVLRDHLDRELHVPDDVETPNEVAHHVERAYESLGMDPFLAGTLADEVANKLDSWQDYHGEPEVPADE